MEYHTRELVLHAEEEEIQGNKVFSKDDHKIPSIKNLGITVNPVCYSKQLKP